MSPVFRKGVVSDGPRESSVCRLSGGRAQSLPSNSRVNRRVHQDFMLVVYTSVIFVSRMREITNGGVSEIFHHGDCCVLIPHLQIQISRHGVESEDVELDPPDPLFPGGFLKLPHRFLSVAHASRVLVDEYVPEICLPHHSVPDPGFNGISPDQQNEHFPRGKTFIPYCDKA